MPRYTQQEDAAILRAYAGGGLDAAAAALPHRTKAAVYQRLLRIRGERRPIADAFPMPRWVCPVRCRDALAATARNAA